MVKPDDVSSKDLESRGQRFKLVTIIRLERESRNHWWFIGLGSGDFSSILKASNRSILSLQAEKKNMFLTTVFQKCPSHENKHSPRSTLLFRRFSQNREHVREIWKRSDQKDKNK